MSKRPIHIILKISLIIIAWGVLLYFLLTYKDYPALLQHFRHAPLQQYLYLLFAIALFPVNQLLEACKWRGLCNVYEPISLTMAQKEVYYGATGAFLTPARLGEYPARMLLRPHTKNDYIMGIALGFIGACITNALTALFGICTAPFYIQQLTFITPFLTFTTLVLMNLCLLFIVFYPLIAKHLANWKHLHPNTKEALQQVAKIGHKKTLKVCLWTMLRYLVFSIQLYLALQFVGIPLNLSQAMITIPIYYLLVTFTPNIPSADPAIRGSWAAFIFSPTAVIATTLIWILNTIFPMLIGSFMTAKTSPQN